MILCLVSSSSVFRSWCQRQTQIPPHFQGTCGMFSEKNQGVVTSSIPTNTSSTYFNAVSCYKKFLSQYGFPLAYPFRAEHIVLFIAYCFQNSFAPSSISTCISGLSFYHKLNNWYDPSGLFVVKKLYEGCHPSSKRTNSCAAIGPQILHATCKRPLLCYNKNEALMFEAAYLLEFLSLLRVSQLVYTTHLHHGRAHQLSDIKSDLEHMAVTVTIHHSKTNQTGPPEHIRIPCEPDYAMCLVCISHKYVMVWPQTEGSLFQHQNGDPLTRGQFSAVLAKCITV